jgi:hypothetical protein
VSWKPVGALTVGLAGTSLNLAWSEETTGDKAKAMEAPASPVSQEQLNAAAKDENNFLHTNKGEGGGGGWQKGRGGHDGEGGNSGGGKPGGHNWQEGRGGHGHDQGNWQGGKRGGGNWKEGRGDHGEGDWQGDHNHHHGHRGNYGWYGPPSGYHRRPYAYSYSYGGYGGCGWIYENAIASGDPYWWEQYYDCLGY